jgi:hypothetical protein
MHGPCLFYHRLLDLEIFEIGHSHQPYNKVRFSEPRVVPLGQISDQFLDP